MKVINYSALTLELKLKLRAELKQECNCWMVMQGDGVIHFFRGSNTWCNLHPLVVVCSKSMLNDSFLMRTHCSLAMQTA